MIRDVMDSFVNMFSNWGITMDSVHIKVYDGTKVL